MKKFLATLLLAFVLPAPGRAEEATARPEKARSSFRIDYALSEVEDGKRTNERTCSLTVNEGSSGQIRSGTRVPVTVGDKGVQYMDVGLRISARALERDGDFTLESEIEQSTLAPVPTLQPNEAKGNPVVRTVSETVSMRPVIGKAAVVSGLDDPGGCKRLQVEVTVSRLR